MTVTLAACDMNGNGSNGNDIGNGNDEPQIGTRNNPAEIGDRLYLEYNSILEGEVEINIILLETVRGEEANNMVQEANQFNPEPEEGEEYLLARFEVEVEYVEEEPFDINHAQFDAVSEDGIVYDDFLSVAGLDPNLRNDLYEGAVHEGWTYFLVDQGDEPLMAYHRTRDYEVWFNPAD